MIKVIDYMYAIWFNTSLTLMKLAKAPSADQSTVQGTVYAAICYLMKSGCPEVSENAETVMTIVKYWPKVSKVFVQSFIAISYHMRGSKESGGNYSTNPVSVILVIILLCILKY